MSNINKKTLKGLLKASEQAFTVGIHFLLVAVKDDGEIEVTGSPEVIRGHQNESSDIKATSKNIFKGGILFCL